MSDETRKIEPTEATELATEILDNIAGGVAVPTQTSAITGNSPQPAQIDYRDKIQEIRSR
jgi:hypothetical protein